MSETAQKKSAEMSCLSSGIMAAMSLMCEKEARKSGDFRVAIVLFSLSRSLSAVMGKMKSWRERLATGQMPVSDRKRYRSDFEDDPHFTLSLLKTGRPSLYPYDR